MFRAFLNALRIPDLRSKILFTILVIAVYRIGSYVPIPNINVANLNEIQQSGQTAGFGLLNFINLFAGGALTRFAVFALGILPYITSSIIMQLLTVVIPRLEQWQKQGEAGVKKITQWTRYMTVTLALIQSTGLVFLFNNQFQGSVRIFTPPRVALMVLTLTAGTAFIMWLGELITQRGIGNGMSILIFTSIISELPSQGTIIFRQGGPVQFGIIFAIGLLVIVAVVFIEQGQR
ncbi:MAG: preprotein translocase subunit SecY, partial [Candidatus Methylomirabilales bacterium]